MAMRENNTEDRGTLSQFSTTINTIHSYDVNKVLVRNNKVSSCTRVCEPNVAIPCDFENATDWLYLNLKSEQVQLEKEREYIIYHNQSYNSIDVDVRGWLELKKSSIFTEYLPYLSTQCEVTFHPCNIKECSKHGRILVPVDQYHDISKAVYYIYDKSIQSITGIFMTDDSYINLVHNKLSQQTDIDIDDKKLLCNILISKYVKQLEDTPSHQHLLSLTKWENLYRAYMDLIELESELDLNNSLIYCRCLIKLNKYDVAEELLTNLVNTIDPINKKKIGEVWCLIAKAQRKSKNYSKKEIKQGKHDQYSAACRSIIIAVGMDPNNEEILKEQEIIYNLMKRKWLKEPHVKNVIQHAKRANDCESYNILSIDGGGIRGIIPAIWLHKLERETKRTCSSMFQMMSGTSTGAMIVAGLSTPHEVRRTIPAYTASKIVQLYTTSGSKIFAGKHRHVWDPRKIPIFLATKYSSNGKEQLFNDYFGNTTLSECLTDIVIPAVRTGDIYTHLFTKDNTLHSTRLVDILMAATAAPTYFDPHFVNGRYSIDGGIQMNNPTSAAYAEAIQYVHDKENIYVLSLGTGDYIQDPLYSNRERDIKFYLRYHEHVRKILFDAQQHNVDYDMSMSMNDKNYHRWQVWPEDFIALDKYDDDTIKQLEEIAYEYWEEMEMDNSNRLNKLIEHLTL